MNSIDLKWQVVSTVPEPKILDSVKQVMERHHG
jgi:hypothetical protein